MGVFVNRRNFLGSAIAGVAGVFVYTFRIGPHHLRVTHRSMPLAGLPSSWVGKRLIHISDFHIGPSVDDAYLKKAFEKVAALEPDVLCFTGDFMTCHDNEEITHVLEVLRALKPANIATVGIPGNHDYAHRWGKIAVADELADKLEQHTEFNILRNRSLEVDGLMLYGLDDLWAHQFNNDLLRKRGERPAIALTHNPDTVDHAGWDDYQGWILAGHTHGGQCKPPFLPPPMLPVQNTTYTKGVFNLAPGRSMHISAGLGHLLKVRFNVRPEITVFDLTDTG